ncbi:hypothetical protein Hypma_010830 [Hypsizygus marmoreus]|uniref:Uncharacterized protein n=1 Tax=Hypsizygus marmoreus TaxID=39966 RepID=A0A369JKZ1_HYPMA|nr:hypothetical protein Hypma_010830 [Hypsizygus marmoreus]
MEAPARSQFHHVPLAVLRATRNQMAQDPLLSTTELFWALDNPRSQEVPALCLEANTSVVRRLVLRHKGDFHGRISVLFLHLKHEEQKMTSGALRMRATEVRERTRPWAYAGF